MAPDKVTLLVTCSYGRQVLKVDSKWPSNTEMAALDRCEQARRRSGLTPNYSNFTTFLSPLCKCQKN